MDGSICASVRSRSIVYLILRGVVWVVHVRTEGVRLDVPLDGGKLAFLPGVVHHHVSPILIGFQAVRLPFDGLSPFELHEGSYQHPIQLLPRGLDHERYVSLIHGGEF